MALPVLAVLASAIGNSRRLKMKSAWDEPAILWTVLVGESGSLKSPSLEKALEPVQEAHAKACLEHKRKLEQYERENSKKKEGEPPKYETIMCSDITVEALISRLQNAPRGLLLARDEFSGFLKSFDQYKKGRGADVAQWLHMNGGRPVQVDRKTNNEIVFIPNGTVCITGGIQPRILEQCLSQEFFDNGMAARLLPAMPPSRPKVWTESDISDAARHAYALVHRSLLGLEPTMDCDENPAPLLIDWSTDAKNLYVEFYDEHNHECRTLPKNLKSVWSKLEGCAARLALVIYCAKEAEGGSDARGEVDMDSMAAGIRLARWFGNEARRVYAMFAADGQNEATKQEQLSRMIEKVGGEATVRDSQRSSSLYADAVEWKEAVDDLARVGLGRWNTIKPGPTGGHPIQEFVLVC